MTQNNENNDVKKDDSEKEEIVFDMYHLFSRFDFWLAIAFILGLLLFIMFFIGSFDNVA